MTFNKILEDIAYRHNLTQVFDDFLQMTVCAFSMGRMEDRYKEVIAKYDKDQVEKFGHALGALVMDYQEVATEGGWDDYLGNYFMDISSKSQVSGLGQFFTPVALCKMMALMTEDEPAKESISVCDPTCGSSRNLIAHSRLDPLNRFNTFYYGMDQDQRCVLMSVIHYVLYGMKGVVIYMNTLSMEVYSGYRIFLPETGMFVKPLTEAECLSYLHEAETAPELVADKTTKQFTLEFPR